MEETKTRKHVQNEPQKTHHRILVFPSFGGLKAIVDGSSIKGIWGKRTLKSHSFTVCVLIRDGF